MSDIAMIGGKGPSTRRGKEESMGWRIIVGGKKGSEKRFDAGS
jgi:hypothetical protein